MSSAGSHATLPDIEIIAPEAWKEFQRFHDDVSAVNVVGFVKTWAGLMQRSLSAGAQLGRVMESSAREASARVGGINSFAYAEAVAALTNYWRFGKEFREAISPVVVTIGEAIGLTKVRAYFIDELAPPVTNG